MHTFLTLNKESGIRLVKTQIIIYTSTYTYLRPYDLWPRVTSYSICHCVLHFITKCYKSINSPEAELNNKVCTSF